MSKDNNLVIPAVIIGISFIIASIIGAFTFYKIRSMDNVITVTGSAKTAVVSDSVKLSMSISRTVNEFTLQKGYSQISKDLAIVLDYLKLRNIDDSSISTTPIFTNEVYKYNDNSGGPKEYNLYQQVVVTSSDVFRITDLAKNTQSITDKGVILSIMQPEYFYSKLAELRVDLLDSAVRDAKARAEKLSLSSGSSVGAMKSASSGVVQVLAPNSVEISDYGQYDTSSIDKEVMITVRASFLVD